MKTLELPEVHSDTSRGITYEPQYQVILFNDEVHTLDEVLEALMRTFLHTKHIAAKIVVEAHNKGKAVAEVEDKEKAILHKQQLESFSPPFTIEVEEISI